MHVPVNKPYISFIGKRNQTASPIITWNSKASDKGPNGNELGTSHSATVGVDSDYFCATGLTFEVRTQFLVSKVQTQYHRFGFPAFTFQHILNGDERTHILFLSINLKHIRNLSHPIFIQRL